MTVEKPNGNDIKSMLTTLSQLLANPMNNRDNMSIYSGPHDPQYAQDMMQVGVESTQYQINNDTKYQEWIKDNPGVQAVLKRTYAIDSDTDIGLINYDPMIMKPLRPSAIGRSLIVNKPVSNPLGRIRYYNEPGRAAKSAKARQNAQSRADRSKLIEYKADDEIETSDFVGLNFKEDQRAQDVSESLMSLGESHQEEISQYCIDALTGGTVAKLAERFGSGSDWTDNSGNSHPRGISIDSGANNVHTLDNLLTM